jgi:hypothetical protein
MECLSNRGKRRLWARLGHDLGTTAAAKIERALHDDQQAEQRQQEEEQLAHHIARKRLATLENQQLQRVIERRGQIRMTVLKRVASAHHQHHAEERQREPGLPQPEGEIVEIGAEQPPEATALPDDARPLADVGRCNAGVSLHAESFGQPIRLMAVPWLP